MSRRWVLFAFFVVLVKSVLFAVDPLPKFFFGDSWSYIASAMTGWIPPDRSFTYPWLIRATLTPRGSLALLPAIQTLAGAGAALLLAVTLTRRFGVRPAVAFACGGLCALEPIQLLYERFVMAEAISLLGFALYLLCALHYVQEGSVRMLACVQGLGIAVVSLRLSYLPIILVNALLLPILRASAAARAFPAGSEVLPGPPAGKAVRSRLHLKTVLHVLFSLVLTWFFHGAYKHLFAALSGYARGYCAASGFFLIATWAPVISVADFPLAAARETVFSGLPFDLKDRAARGRQLFDEGGLVERMRALMPEEEANRAALETALNALKRDPWGVVLLSLRTFGDYFDVAILMEKITNDLALDQQQEYRDFQRYYGELLQLPAEREAAAVTLTKRYYRAAVPWYWFLLLSPLGAAFALLPLNRPGGALLVEVVVALWTCTAVAACLTVHPVVRYLHPLGYLVLCLLGVVGDRAFALQAYARMRA
jgi:hypothetical protein